MECSTAVLYLKDEALPGPLGVERLLAEVRLPPLAPEAVVGRNAGARTPVGVGDLEVAHAVRIGEALQARGAKASGSQHLEELKTKRHREILQWYTLPL